MASTAHWAVFAVMQSLLRKFNRSIFFVGRRSSLPSYIVVVALVSPVLVSLVRVRAHIPTAAVPGSGFIAIRSRFWFATIPPGTVLSRTRQRRKFAGIEVCRDGT